MSIQAVTDKRGSFRQGDLSSIFIRITDFDGNPTDPEAITATIDDNDGLEIVAASVPEKVVDGFYILDWVVDAVQAAGKYIVTWDYTVDSVDYEEIQNLVVAADATDTAFYSSRIVDFRMALEDHLGEVQKIPVMDEEGRPNNARTEYSFSFKRWNPMGGVRIYRNQELVTSGVEVDYTNGKVVFDSPLLRQEAVNVYYRFKWFGDMELDRFLSNGVHAVNAVPPASTYSLATVPDEQIATVLYGATKDALRRLMIDLQYQVPQQVYGGPEDAQRAFSNFETLKQNYEKDWEFLLEKKKFGTWPRLRIVAVPEYTLPGGRSRWFRYLFKGSS
tara:strand:+ start:1900 stop:2895 length:996 start_codon:yes stop_codon:yes gene_type:complete